MKSCSAITIGLALAVSLAPAAIGQTGTADRLRQPDNTFLTKAAQGGMEEVELGKLAVERASDPKVKNFGQRMVDDHSAANDKLKQVAAKKNVSLPPQMTEEQQRTKAKLAKLSGAEFDRSYMEYMVNDHKADVAEFQREGNSGNDPDVKGFAQETLPTLQDHLRMAQDVHAQLKK